MKNRIFILIILFAIFSGCKDKYTPKPRGFFRIGFPEKSYITFNHSGFPYAFEIPAYSSIKRIKGTGSGLYDINISIPQNKADFHISYKQLNENGKTQTSIETTKLKLSKLSEDSRKLAYKHTIKADAIEERIFLNPADNVYGTIYMIQGNAASPLQFYLTDSIKHFLRGSFYIRDIPNIDSLKPVVDFLEPDLIRLIETTTWK